MTYKRNDIPPPRYVCDQCSTTATGVVPTLSGSEFWVTPEAWRYRLWGYQDGQYIGDSWHLLPSGVERTGLLVCSPSCDSDWISEHNVTGSMIWYSRGLPLLTWVRKQDSDND